LSHGGADLEIPTRGGRAPRLDGAAELAYRAGMPLELYLAFVLATAILILMPGPIVSLVVAHSLSQGTRSGLVTVAGAESGQVIQLVFVALGMTSLIHFFATWFELLRWAGVAYLVWLGVQRWRRSFGAEPPQAVPAVGARTLFAQGFVVAVTNPKTWLFYAAFFPQFIDPASAPGPQLAILCSSYLAIAATIDGAYALLAGRVRPWLQGGWRARLCDRVTGTLLIGAGVWLALARRG